MLLRALRRFAAICRSLATVRPLPKGLFGGLLKGENFAINYPVGALPHLCGKVGAIFGNATQYLVATRLQRCLHPVQLF